MTSTKTRAANVLSVLKQLRTATDDSFEAQIVFGVVFEDYNYEEDVNSDDPDAKARVEEFLAQGNGDEVQAALKSEDLAVAEVAEKFSKALGRPVRIANEGHNDRELVCKFWVEGKDELRKALDAIDRMSYNPEGHTALNAIYTEAGSWTIFVYPNGSRTGGEIRFDYDRSRDDLEEYLAGVTTARVVTRRVATNPDEWVCPDCGKDDVAATAWVNVNTNNIVEPTYKSRYFCYDCGQEMDGIVRRRDYKG